MQLDRVPPPHSVRQEIGTSEPAPGVEPVAGSERERAPARRSDAWLGWGCALLAFALLGQGERCDVDARFSSPSRTLQTYWRALREGDEATAAECFVEGPHDLPFAGQLWFLPPTQTFDLDEFKSLPVESGRLLVSYDVRFLPVGSPTELRFRTGSELVRMRGEWRIARPLGDASMPEWKPIPHVFDS